MSSPITVRLVGGLGNQLFGYYAGGALAGHLGVGLRLDTSWTRHGFTDHGIEILRLDLPGEWLAPRSSDRLTAPGTMPARIVAKTLREIPALRKPFRIHEAAGIGDDPKLFDQPPGTRLRGYFQSWRIVERAVQAGYPRRPDLRRASPWLDSMIRRAADERPIAAHVRRGDYARNPTFGLLGPAYYERAIAYAKQERPGQPLWVFSDDPDAARHALGRFGSVAQVIASPDGAVTEMLLISHADAVVIANSTFSWWGAWMSQPSTRVVAPDPWFESGPPVEGLIPPGWTTVPAG